MLTEAQARGGALLDGKLEEYERAWKAAGGEDITSDGLEDLFVKLGQPLDAQRLAQVRDGCARLLPGCGRALALLVAGLCVQQIFGLAKRAWG